MVGSEGQMSVSVLHGVLDMLRGGVGKYDESKTEEWQIAYMRMVADAVGAVSVVESEGLVGSVGSNGMGLVRGSRDGIDVVVGKFRSRFGGCYGSGDVGESVRCIRRDGVNTLSNAVENSDARSEDCADNFHKSSSGGGATVGTDGLQGTARCSSACETAVCSHKQVHVCGVGCDSKERGRATVCSVVSLGENVVRNRNWRKEKKERKLRKQAGGFDSRFSGGSQNWRSVAGVPPQLADSWIVRKNAENELAAAVARQKVEDMRVCVERKSKKEEELGGWAETVCSGSVGSPGSLDKSVWSGSGATSKTDASGVANGKSVIESVISLERHELLVAKVKGELAEKEREVEEVKRKFSKSVVSVDEHNKVVARLAEAKAIMVRSGALIRQLQKEKEERKEMDDADLRSNSW